MAPDRWRKIEALYDAVIEVEPGQRAALLDQSCAGDNTLRREVESLLFHGENAGSFLHLPAPLEPGQCVSHYEIQQKLGAGGMGAVYRAYDRQLRRPVALKVLSPNCASDPERRERLLREARAASALNHRNIVGIHEVGSDNGVDFIAMEFIDGKPLNEVLPAKGLPLETALDYAAQIAGALAEAHAAGVVHRDLKPGNIMVTPAGTVKLLDFGLARRVRLGQDHDTTLTGEGVIAGTPAYMSPEQAEGKAIDERSDIFSFGAVLYETLTGQRAFSGDSAASVLMAVLRQEAPPLGTKVPPELEKIVTRCLRKHAASRFQHMDDVNVELEELRREWEAGRLHRAPVPEPRRSVRRYWIAGLSATAVILAAVLVWIFREGALKPSLHLTIRLPDDAPLAAAGNVSPAHDRPALALSRDGARLAYVAQTGENTQICLRDMTNGKVACLAGTEGGHTPFFSPDGASVAFFTASKLKKIPSTGGAVAVLADAPNPWGGVWGTDDNIYFNRFEGEGLLSVASDGGAVQVVTTDVCVMPDLLGGGQRLLATTSTGTVYMKGSETPKFVVSGFGARYAPTGHLVYAQPGKLLAMPFDGSRIEATGPAVSLFEDLRTAHYGVAQFTFGQDGTLVYASGHDQRLNTFVWVDRNGKVQPLGLPERLYSAFDLSPDGRRLAVTVLSEMQGGEVGIWIYDLLGGATYRLTPRSPVGRPVQNRYPRWTPDGRHVVYVRQQELQSQLVWAADDGSTEPVVLWSNRATGPPWMYPMSFSKDGSVMVVFGHSPGSSHDIWLIRLEGRDRPVARAPEFFVGGSFAECFGQISPDERWMLYSSDQSGVYENYVTSYSKPGAIHQISRNGGRESLWSPSGAEILYLDGRQMYAVDVIPGPVFRTGAPRLLFEGPYPDVPGFGYDIAPDGRRVLMLESKDLLKPSTTLTVVTNFFDELRRRAPSGSAAPR